MKKLIKVLKFVLRKLRALLVIVFRFLVRCIRAISRKKRYAIPFYSFIAYFVLVVLLIKFSGDSAYDKVIPNKRINDVTQLNPIQVGREIRPQSVEEIVEAIKSTQGPISIGGG